MKKPPAPARNGGWQSERIRLSNRMSSLFISGSNVMKRETDRSGHGFRPRTGQLSCFFGCFKHAPCLDDFHPLTCSCFKQKAIDIHLHSALSCFLYTSPLYQGTGMIWLTEYYGLMKNLLPSCERLGPKLLKKQLLRFSCFFVYIQ